MADNATTQLTVENRQAKGSRESRRIRLSGLVPATVYGSDTQPQSVQIDARALRPALAHGGGVIDLKIGDGKQKSTPVVIKDVQYHPVGGQPVHVDFMRVRLDQPISATVTVELVGGDESPGGKAGGILEQHAREVNVEALPTAIPDAIQIDVSGLEIQASVTFGELQLPDGVSLLDDVETMAAIITPPRLAIEEEEAAAAAEAEEAEEAQAEQAAGEEGTQESESE